MIKSLDLKVSEDGAIKLPSFLMKLLLLKGDEKISLHYDSDIQDKTFYISTENEEDIFEDDFFCVPKRICENCNINYEDIIVLEDEGILHLTTREKILSSLGTEVLGCLLEQGVDLNILAEDLANVLNHQYHEQDV